MFALSEELFMLYMSVADRGKKTSADGARCLVRGVGWPAPVSRSADASTNDLAVGDAPSQES